MHYRDLEQTEPYCPKDEGIKEKRAAAISRSFKASKFKSVFGKYKPGMKSKATQQGPSFLKKSSAVQFGHKEHPNLKLSAMRNELMKLSVPQAEHDVPARVEEIADAVRRDDRRMPDATAHRIAWKAYHKEQGTKPETPKQPLTGYTGGRKGK